MLPSSLAEKCNPQILGETLSQRNRGKVIKEDPDAFWPLSITGVCTNTHKYLEFFISSISRKKRALVWIKRAVQIAVISRM